MKVFLRKFLFNPFRQIIWISLVAVSVGICTFYFDTEIRLDKKQFIDLLTLFAQLSGILLGFLISFFFFVFQSKESLKMQWFLEYRKTIDELVNKLVNLPNELHYLSKHLGAIISNLENVTIDDFPNDYLKQSYGDIEKIVKDEIKIDPIFNREILYIVGKTEQYSNKINLTIIGVWTSSALINSIYKQLAILILSVLLLFLTVISGYDFNSYIFLSTSLTIGILTVLGFAELVLYIADFYRNRLSEINNNYNFKQPENEKPNT